MNLCPKPELYIHELGHAVGFGGRTSDGSVMDPTPRNTTITPTVQEMLFALYKLPVGYAPTKAEVQTYFRFYSKLQNQAKIAKAGAVAPAFAASQ